VSERAAEEWTSALGLEAEADTSCVGLFGVIPLTAGPYALLITRATSVGDLPGGGVIWSVGAVQAVPLTLAAAKAGVGSAALPWEVAAMEDDEK